MAVRDFADISAKSRHSVSVIYITLHTHLIGERTTDYSPIAFIEQSLMIDCSSIAWANSRHSYVIIIHAKICNCGDWLLKILLLVLKLAHSNIKLHYWVSK